MKPGWEELKPPRFKAPRERIDPYLWIADAIGYADHRPLATAGDTNIPVAVQVPEGGRRPQSEGFHWQAGHAGSRFFTGVASTQALDALLSDPNSVSVRVQYAEALLPQRMPVPWATGDQRRIEAVKQRDRVYERAGTTLVGIIDSGCPFAHADLRSSKSSTRVLRLWDQGSGATYGGLGTPPTAVGFDYGCELTRAELDALMEATTTSGDGSIDEQACYRLAGCGRLMGRVSHGAHSLGMMAASRRWRTRPSGGPPEMRTGRATEPSRDADIAFVQFPHDVMACISVAALERHAIDGFRYLLKTAIALGYSRLVISFGYESWVGPHDGTTWFEQALDELIAEQPESRIDMEVYTIAGNAKGRKVHATFDGPRQADLTLVVQPANEVPTLVEIWAPEGAGKLRFNLTPPHGGQLPEVSWGEAVVWPEAARPMACVVMHKSTVPGRDGHVILLRISPTQVVGGRQAAAPHGHWKISLEAETGSLAGVHAYVGRSEETLGSEQRARQSCFAAHREQGVVLDKQGTMNGHAGGVNVNVCGAYYSAGFPYQTASGDAAVENLRGAAARYSGRGPLRGGRHRAPDYSMAVDDGLYHSGVLGMGNFSATLFRLSGTSVAAPLRARLAVDQTRTRGATPDPPESKPPASDELGEIHDPFDGSLAT